MYLFLLALIVEATTATTHRVIPPMPGPAPARWARVEVPDLGVAIRRISDVGDLPPVDAANYNGKPGMGLTNGYSSYPACNVGGSLALAVGTHPWINALYDLLTGHYLGQPKYQVSPTDLRTMVFGEQAGARWAGPDNLILKAIYSGANALYLWRINPRQGTQNIIADFSARGGLMNMDHVGQSRDGIWRGWRCADGSSGILHLPTGAIYEVMSKGSGAGEVDISPSGTWAVVDPGAGAALRFYRVSQVQAGNLSDWLPSPASGAHSGWAWDPEGNEVFIAMSNADDQFFMFDPAKDRRTNIFGMGAWGWDFGYHFGAIQYPTTPGWALMTTYGGSGWYEDQVLMLELKPGGRIVRLGSYNSWMAAGADKPQRYFAEGWASLDGSGNYVYGGWNWFGRDNLELYRLELPAGWHRIDTAPTPIPTVTPTPTPTPRTVRVRIPEHVLEVEVEE